MKKLILLFCGFIPWALSAQTEGINFLSDSTLQSALAKAKKANKLLFVDCYTSWCGPCKYMSNTIFPMPTVGAFYNDHFLNWKIDCEKVNKVDVTAFGKYGVKAFPTYLFLDGDGQVVHQALGARPAEQFIEVGKIALDPTQNSSGILKKMLSGDRSLATLNSYYMSDINAPSKYIDEYFATAADSAKLSLPAWQLFNHFMNNIDGTAFHYFLAHKAQYEQKVGKDEVDKKILSLLGYYARPGKEKEYEQIAQIDATLAAKAKMQNDYFKLQMALNRNPGDKEILDKLVATAVQLDNQYKMEIGMLNDLSWTIYLNYKKADDMEALKQAQIWSKRTVDAQPTNHAYNDTYAHILFDLGQKEEAIRLEEAALVKATEEQASDQISFYTKEIKRFKGLQ
jgi:thiol-disulfide isomerase/thioredoxin